jgi:hypothetical protein
MKTSYFLLLSFALVLPCLSAEPRFDGSYLDGLPSQRAQAFRKAQGTSADSTADIHRKSEAYYSALKKFIQGLRRRYYYHTEWPHDLFAGLEAHAVVLTGIEYPLSATGASGYDGILIRTKIRLAAEIISAMSKAIYSEAYWNTIANKPSKKGTDLYQNWLKRWNESGTAD